MQKDHHKIVCKWSNYLSFRLAHWLHKHAWNSDKYNLLKYVLTQNLGHSDCSWRKMETSINVEVEVQGNSEKVHKIKKKKKADDCWGLYLHWLANAAFCSFFFSISRRAFRHCKQNQENHGKIRNSAGAISSPISFSARTKIHKKIHKISAIESKSIKYSRWTICGIRDMLTSMAKGKHEFHQKNNVKSQQQSLSLPSRLQTLKMQAERRQRTTRQ